MLSHGGSYTDGVDRRRTKSYLDELEVLIASSNMAPSKQKRGLVLVRCLASLLDGMDGQLSLLDTQRLSALAETGRLSQVLSEHTTRRCGPTSYRSGDDLDLPLKARYLLPENEDLKDKVRRYKARLQIMERRVQEQEQAILNLEMRNATLQCSAQDAAKGQGPQQEVASLWQELLTKESRLRELETQLHLLSDLADLNQTARLGQRPSLDGSHASHAGRQPHQPPMHTGMPLVATSSRPSQQQQSHTPASSHAAASLYQGPPPAAINGGSPRRGGAMRLSVPHSATAAAAASSSQGGGLTVSPSTESLESPSGRLPAISPGAAGKTQLNRGSPTKGFSSPQPEQELREAVSTPFNRLPKYIGNYVTMTGTSEPVQLKSLNSGTTVTAVRSRNERAAAERVPSTGHESAHSPLGSQRATLAVAEAAAELPAAVAADAAVRPSPPASRSATAGTTSSSLRSQSGLRVAEAEGPVEGAAVHGAAGDAVAVSQSSDEEREGALAGSSEPAAAEGELVREVEGAGVEAEAAAGEVLSGAKEAVGTEEEEAAAGGEGLEVGQGGEVGDAAAGTTTADGGLTESTEEAPQVEGQSKAPSGEGASVEPGQGE